MNKLNLYSITLILWEFKKSMPHLAFGVVALEGVNVTNGKSIFESQDNSPLS